MPTFHIVNIHQTAPPWLVLTTIWLQIRKSRRQLADHVHIKCVHVVVSMWHRPAGSVPVKPISCQCTRTLSRRQLTFHQRFHYLHALFWNSTFLLTMGAREQCPFPQESVGGWRNEWMSLAPVGDREHICLQIFAPVTPHVMYFLSTPSLLFSLLSEKDMVDG